VLEQPSRVYLPKVVNSWASVCHKVPGTVKRTLKWANSPYSVNPLYAAKAKRSGVYPIKYMRTRLRKSMLEPLVCTTPAAGLRAPPMVCPLGLHLLHPIRAPRDSSPQFCTPPFRKGSVSPPVPVDLTRARSVLWHVRVPGTGSGRSTCGSARDVATRQLHPYPQIACPSPSPPPTPAVIPLGGAPTGGRSSPCLLADRTCLVHTSPPSTMCLFLCLPTRRPRASPPRRKCPPKPASPVPTWAFSPAHPRWTRDGALEAQRGVNGGASATRLSVAQLCTVLESLLAGMMAELPAADAAARAANVLTRAVAVDLAHAVADSGQRLEAVQRDRADGVIGADTFTDAWAAAQRVSVVRDNLEVFHPLGALRRQARLAAPATAAEGAPVAPRPSCSTNIAAFFHSPDASPDVRAFVTTVRDALGGLEASPTKMVLALSLLLMAVTVDRALEVSAWNWRRLLFAAAAAAHLSVDGAMADLPALARRSGVMRGADDLHMCMRVLLEVLNESFVIDKQVLAGVEGDLVDGYAEQTGQRIEPGGTSGAKACGRDATGGREARVALPRAAD